MADGQQLNQNLQGAQQAASATEQSLQNAIQTAARLAEEARSLTAELRDQLNIRNRLSDGEKELLSISRKITQSAQENKQLLGDSNKIKKQIEKEESQRLAAERERQIIINDLTALGNYSAISAAQNIANINKEISASNEKELELLKSINSSTGQEKNDLIDQLGIQRGLTEDLHKQLSISLENADSDTQRLALANQLVVAAQNNIKESEKELNTQNKINNAIGITGKTLEGLNKIGGQFASAFKLNNVVSKMKEFAEEEIRAGREAGRLQTLGAGIKEGWKGFKDTLTDPVVIIGALVAGFNEVDKSNVQFMRSTGQNLNSFSASFSTLTATGDKLKGSYITLADYIQTASELTKELGQNATAIFTSADLLEASEMTKLMGMSAKEGAELALLSKVNGNNIKEQNKSLVEGVNSSNRQYKTVVGAGDVLKDIANTSQGIAISYAGYPEKLGQAATAAKALGMNLGQVDKMASSLLQFESSISSEMEAELLTGKALNLEKAREFALSNDLEGVARELSTQGINAYNFGKLNRIQQEAQAKALGMTRDEMSKMLLTQEMGKNLNEEALSSAQKQELASLKQEEATKKIKDAVAKLAQAFAPIIDIIATVVSNAWVITGIIGVALLSKLGPVVKGFSNIAGSLKDAWKSATGLLKSGWQAITGNRQGAAETLRNTVTGGTSQVSQAGERMRPGVGAGIKENLKSLGEGLKEMAGGKVTQGILNLALAGPALILALPSIPFLLFMGLTPLVQLKTNFENLGQGLAEMAGGKVLAGIGALALAGPALILALGSIPFLSFMALPIFTFVQKGFEGLANGVGALGQNFSNMAKGSLAIALLGASLIPATFAFSLLKEVDLGKMIAFSIALPLLALATAGLGFIAPYIMLGSLALASLGASLIPAAIGFEKLGNANIDGMVSSLSTLASLGPGLLSTAAALYAVAGGMTAVGVAGYLAVPAMALMSMFGSPSEKKEEKTTPQESQNNEMARVNSNLEKLIALVEKGGDVYIDGAKVGKALQLSTSKMG